MKMMLSKQLGVCPKPSIRFGEDILACSDGSALRPLTASAEYNQAKVRRRHAEEPRQRRLLCRPQRAMATTTSAATRSSASTPTRFHTEAALVRPQITCGTHALTVALSRKPAAGRRAALARRRARMTRWRRSSASASRACSLKEYGVSYRQADLQRRTARFDYEGIRAAINEKTKLVTIQRSKGYADPPDAFGQADRRADRLCEVGSSPASSAWWTTATANLSSRSSPATSART